MTKVFIGGSRDIRRLDPRIIERIERMIDKGLSIVVGDANGADKAVQRLLKDRAYGRVEIFCSDSSPRNNLGGWTVRVIRPAHKTRDFDYFATKDRAMAHEATVGLMIWDGESRGTLLNILRLMDQRKTVVVFVGRSRSFVEVRSHRDFDALVSDLSSTALKRLDELATSEGLTAVRTEQAHLPL